MNPEDYVSYPLALALKKHGFDWGCPDFYWTSDGTFKYTNTPVYKNRKYCTTMVSAPTLWKAQKWLREKKNLSVEPFSSLEKGKYTYEIIFVDTGFDYKSYKTVSYRFDSYEEALSAGIAAALELIEEKGE